MVLEPHGLLCRTGAAQEKTSSWLPLQPPLHWIHPSEQGLELGHFPDKPHPRAVPSTPPCHPSGARHPLPNTIPKAQARGRCTPLLAPKPCSSWDIPGAPQCMTSHSTMTWHPASVPSRPQGHPLFPQHSWPSSTTCASHLCQSVPAAPLHATPRPSVKTPKHHPSGVPFPREAAAAPTRSALAPPPARGCWGQVRGRAATVLSFPKHYRSVLLRPRVPPWPWSPGHRCHQPGLTQSIPSVAACPIPAPRDAMCQHRPQPRIISPRAAASSVGAACAPGAITTTQTKSLNSALPWLCLGFLTSFLLCKNPPLPRSVTASACDTISPDATATLPNIFSLQR